MAGYRQSSFDPSAGGNYGPPLRPFNNWQRLGAALIVGGGLLAVGLVVRQIATGDHATADWIPVSTCILLLGSVLVNSRREKLTPEQCARQRRRALIVAAIGLGACALGFAAVFYFKGAWS